MAASQGFVNCCCRKNKCGCNPCPRGPVGEKGLDGQAGKSGPRGPQGSPGLDASTVGVPEYAEFFTKLDPSQGSSVLVARDELIPFENVRVSSPKITLNGDNTIQLGAGYYRISWRVPTCFPATLQLKNGDGQLLTWTITGSNQGCEITNTVVYEIADGGGSICLVNPGAEFEIPTSSDGVTALTYNIVIVCIHVVEKNPSV